SPPEFPFRHLPQYRSRPFPASPGSDCSIRPDVHPLHYPQFHKSNGLTLFWRRCRYTCPASFSPPPVLPAPLCCWHRNLISLSFHSSGLFYFQKTLKSLCHSIVIIRIRHILCRLSDFRRAVFHGHGTACPLQHLHIVAAVADGHHILPGQPQKFT